ncbi:FtsX-like permease family protein [Cuneatibacter sp. NSJ-177]|uniref:ABC transporter permease n=1 Tax=Cuneatibacter sp. NSJ-177 TaxID=2931401 RepID=UPI001FD1AC15|nr:FtsX-like permease family protein [Cuneatibacter sp. NSJ-177]MCJ7835390.1 FtsX-like permease family protein [Cuneatibacter sp. NSJ-177]
MKQAQRKDFFREIRKSWNRWLSLLFIVALGVAFFSGVRSSEPDMRLSADRLYDQTNFMDIRILGTLGVTDDDLKAIREIPGVKDAEAASSLEALADDGEEELVLQVSSLTERVNLPTLLDGRLPETTSECLIDTTLSDVYPIGSTIALYDDKKKEDEDSGEGSLADTLEKTEFTVVGHMTSSYYLTFDRGTASIGDGHIDGLLFVLPETFTEDYHTVIYATVEGAAALTAMSETYDNQIQSVTDEIEKIADARCEIRYQSILDEANEKLEDGKKELADAKEEAETELGDALKDLQDGEAELEDAKTTLAEKEQELEDGRQEIADAKKKLKKSREELDNGWKQYNTGKEALADSERDLTQAKEQLEPKEQELAAGWEAYQTGKSEYDTNAAQLESLKGQKDQLEVALTAQGIDPSQSADYLTLAGTIAQMEPALAGAKKQLDETYSTLSDSQDQMDAAKAQIAEGEAQLTAGKEELDASYAKLQDGEDQYQDGKNALEEAKAKIEDGEQQIEDAKTEIADAEKELEDGWKDYEDGQKEADEKIADAEQKLKDAEDEISDIKYPEWYVLDRNSVQTYVEYDLDAQRIGAIGKVFPAIFFLVAALVSLTTMTRMVEDDRTQIGTMKALGYSKNSIAAKYILYALSATLLGSLLGVVAGSQILPRVIMSAYGILYVNLKEYVVPIQTNYALMSTALAVLCTVAATVAACYRELTSTPAQLMRPVAPKEGRRVLLEYIPFIWKRLGFTSKSTVRNLIRYKKRFFMTVFGIGGCMALLMVGFGLRDSIAKIADNQYSTVFTYDATLNIDSDFDPESTEEMVKQYSQIHETLPIYQIAKDAGYGSTTKEATLFVPERLDSLGDFVNLKNRVSKEHYTLSDDGVIITEKLARMLDVSVGDTISLAEEETSTVDVTVTAIVENYLHHYVYMTPALYEKLYGKTPEYNTLLMTTETMESPQENDLAAKLISHDEILSVSFIRSLQATVDDMMRSLDLVIWVLIISAGLLAFVVLYNLNNINISERRRELATLKVLGFYDGEVASYVYRENILLTILGIGAGMLLGVGLHKFLIRTVEIDMLMFGQTIQPPSYLYSSLLTVVFSVLVNLLVFFKLRKIDMIESLKSVE